MIFLWVQFFIASAIIILAGTRLSYVGDGIAEKKKWGRTWVGLILISISTSLPELFTSCAASGMEKQPNLVYGTLLGSVCFNLAIFAFLDLIEGRGALSSKLSRSLVFNGGLSILLILLAVSGILFLDRFSIGWIGISSFLILIVYIVGSKLYFDRNVKDAVETGLNEFKFSKVSTASLWRNYILCAFFILVAGLWLARTGDAISHKTGIGRSFMGFMFLAIVSSLPELSTTIVAVRNKFYDMAVGIILGSNCFNMLIFFAADLLYPRGPISRYASKESIVMAGLGICLTSILMLGIVRRCQKALFRLGWDAVSMIILYLLGAIWLYYGAG